MPFDMSTFKRVMHRVVFLVIAVIIIGWIPYCTWRIVQGTYPNMADTFNSLTAHAQLWFMFGSTLGGICLAIIAVFSGMESFGFMSDILDQYDQFSIPELLAAIIFAGISSVTAPFALLCAFFGF